MARKRSVRATMFMIHRAAELNEAGLSWEAVVRVIELDFGASPGPSTLRSHAHKYFPQLKNDTYKPGGSRNRSGLKHKPKNSFAKKTDQKKPDQKAR